MNKLTLGGGLLAAVVWGYVAVGPSGVLPRAAGAGLPMPKKSFNEQGGAIASVDLESWVAACEAAGLPPIPDPNGAEYEPLKRLIEASARWAANGDGNELGRMGQILLALGLHNAAIPYFAAAREIGTQPETWAYFLGAELQLIGASRAAIAALEQAQTLDPAYATTSTRLGALHFELGEFDRADENYALAATRLPFPTAGLVGRARVALAREDAAAALGFLDAALRDVPRDFLAHRLRSQALSALGRSAEAARAAETSNELPPYRGWLTFDPRLGEVHAMAGTQASIEATLALAISRGDLRAAAEAGELLLKRSPRSVPVLSVLSRILANVGNSTRALELARQAAELEPNNLQAQKVLADIAISVGDLESAGRAAKAMVELAPQDPGAHEVLGRLYFKQGHAQEAVAELRRAVQLDPRNPRPRLLLVDVLRRGNQLHEAELELERLLAFDPQNKEAQAILEALRGR